MMNKLGINLLLILSFYSCNTYKTFYKTTENSIDPTSNIEKIYRYEVKTYQFQTVEDNLRQLTELRMLNLSKTTTDVDSLNSLLNAIPSPENLHVLLLDSLDLKVLPMGIKRFKNLKQLSLNNNPQLNLDQAFSYMQDLPLKFLNLQHNQLTKLPASIHYLKSVEDLNLSNNHLTDAKTYTYLAQLDNLSSLWLDDNNLETLPNTIGQLQQLRNLNFENNHITYLPQDFYKMKRVWVIHAGHNEFTSLPEQFAQMKSLLLLHINNCNINKIPAAFNTKKAPLFGLIMDHNNLSEKDKIIWRKNFKKFFVLSLQ